LQSSPSVPKDRCDRRRSSLESGWVTGANGQKALKG
jgi:hypothetical protein